MNTRIVKIIISLSLIVMVAGIAVNAQDFKVYGHIPFNFMLGDVSMPAGDYNVTKLNVGNGRVFQVRDRDCENYALRFVNQLERMKAPTDTVLVFNRYGGYGGEESYFLSQIWVEGNNTGYEVIKHRAEREAAERAAKRDIITIVVNRADRRAE